MTKKQIETELKSLNEKKIELERQLQKEIEFSLKLKNYVNKYIQYYDCYGYLTIEYVVDFDNTQTSVYFVTNKSYKFKDSLISIHIGRLGNNLSLETFSKIKILSKEKALEIIREQINQELEKF